MRSFIIAVLIFLIICIMITINTVYVTSKVDGLLLFCEKLKTDSSAATTENLLAEWQSCRDIIALSVHRVDLERAENAVLALAKYREVPSDFQYQLSLLISALKHIADEQCITLDSIF